MEHTGQYWFPYPSRAQYFLLAWLPTPLSTWCCQNPCNPSSCTTSTPGPHWVNPSPPGQPWEQSPVDDPHVEMERKPQLKSRGSVAKEDDPKPFHQLYSCTLSLHDKLDRLFVYGIYKRTLRAPTKKNKNKQTNKQTKKTLVLIAGH